MNAQDEIFQLLYSPGDHMTGSAMTDDEALAFARDKLPFGQYCLVRDWIWIDLDVNQLQAAELQKYLRKPALIYAHSVIIDSERRWDVGDSVRTSPLVSFEDDFLFRTTNSTYLLLGDGVRKRAPFDVVGQIFL